MRIMIFSSVSPSAGVVCAMKRGEDLQRNVLERGGRAVEQFEDVVVAERLRGVMRCRTLLAVSVGDALRELGLG